MWVAPRSRRDYLIRLGLAERQTSAPRDEPQETVTEEVKDG
jgi:hypothetical protein